MLPAQLLLPILIRYLQPYLYLKFVVQLLFTKNKTTSKKQYCSKTVALESLSRKDRFKKNKNVINIKVY